MASFTLTISVTDITSVIALFDKVRVYRSVTGNEADRVLFDSFDLVAGQTTYTWTDLNALSTYVAWFTYFNSSTLAESGFSDPLQYGDASQEFVPGFGYLYTTYPVEYSLEFSEKQIVDDIRLLIGDRKQVKRDYVSIDTNYENVSEDGTTYRFSDPPGWPLQVTLDGNEYTSLIEPVVNGYEFLTFSGTSISTVTGTLDVWWESFRNSDTQVFWAYINAIKPPWLSNAQFTTTIKTYVAAVSLLETELRNLMGQTSGSFRLDGELSYDPSSVLAERRKDLDDLRKQLDEILEDAVSGSFSGVRID